MFTPSLTGIGERSHLTGPRSTHDPRTRRGQSDLYEDLDDIVLLGFSYGCFVVTGSLVHIGNRVRHLVYLDAFVPDDGDSVLGLTMLPVSYDPGATPLVVGEQWLVPPAPREFDDPAEAEFMNARRGPHPMGCFTEPVRLVGSLEAFPFTRTYIRATADAPDAPGTANFDAAATRAPESDARDYHEIATNHMVANNQPRRLVEILLTLA